MRSKEEIFNNGLSKTISCYQKKGNKYSLIKVEVKEKFHMPDKPDCPELNKEKQSSCSEIVSVFQEQFSLRDENERDYY